MKTEDPSSSSGPAGDISPISGTVSNLPEASKADSKPTETKKRKAEPSSEKLPNFSRVTPAQLAHVVFPAEGRFQPVRPVSTRTPKSSKGKSTAQSAAKTPASAALGTTAERYAGGGGILILIDQSPDEEAEFIEAEVPPADEPAVAPSVGVPVTSGSSTAARHIALDENAPESDPPQSFEVCVLYVFVDINLLTPLLVPV